MHSFWWSHCMDKLSKLSIFLFWFCFSNKVRFFFYMCELLDFFFSYRNLFTVSELMWETLRAKFALWSLFYTSVIIYIYVVKELTLPLSSWTFLLSLSVVLPLTETKLDDRSSLVSVLRGEVSIFHRPVSQYLKNVHRWTVKQQPQMEGLPLLIQNGNEKYLTCSKPLRSPVTEQCGSETDLATASPAVCNNNKVNQHSAAVEIK